MPLATTRRAGLVDQVIEQMRSAITTGEWPVGQRIPPEPELVTALGVGRNTVREAVRAASPDAILVAGDLALNGPDPAATVDGIRELEAAGALVIAGNTDIAVADFDYAAAFPWLADGIPETQRYAAEWAHEALGPDRVDWLRKVITPERIAATRKLQGIASELSCTLPQLAIAWCAANEHVSTVITGASGVEQVRENLGSAAVVERLTQDVMHEIEAVLKNRP